MIRSFDLKNNYQLIDDGPIETSTVITIDSKSGKMIKHWGSNLFYLPHGLTVDSDFLWLTDVGLHQIFKFPIDGSQQPLITLGQRFIPGNSENHFCKPTSVAIYFVNKDIYVADGYCNSRIARFNSEGKFLNQWGHSNPIGNFY